MSTDAEFQIVRVLRGYTGFEDVYQGTSLAFPIVLSTSRSGRDPIANNAYAALQAEGYAKGSFANLVNNLTGIDPALVAGEPCHPGASLLLDLPIFTVSGATLNEEPVVLYPQYTIIWRYRDAESYATARRGFHAHGVNGLASTQPVTINGGTTSGVSFADGAVRRRCVPCSIETFTYPQKQTDISVANGTVASLYGVQYTVTAGTGYPLTPLLPSIKKGGDPVQGLLAQGVLPDTVLDQPVSWNKIETSCKGDEFIVVMSFNQSLFDAGTYDFQPAGGTRLISYFFGDDVGSSDPFPNPGLGVLACVGTR